jgi:hypothetical protein
MQNGNATYHRLQAAMTRGCLTLTKTRSRPTEARPTVGDTRPNSTGVSG